MIAEEQVIFVHPDGRRAAGRIAIGAPEWVDANHARCAIALDGVSTFPGPVFGASPLQALLLAVQLLGQTLHSFLARGGRIVDPTDQTDFAAAAFFGPLLREA